MRLWNPLLVAAAAAGLAAPPARAEVKPHPLFSDHAVLQRDVPVTVWGTADPGEPVQVTLEMKKAGEARASAASATAGKDGKWKVVLAAHPAGTGYKLGIKGKANEVALTDVAFGDVWVCSGQSNMEWRLNQLPKDDQGKKVAAAATNPNIRLFTVPNRPSAEPVTDIAVNPKAGEGLWLECKPDTVINFSAVGYFFGRDIQKALNVPVGLISADWGGTVCEAWTSKEALEAVPELKYLAEKTEAAKKEYNPQKADAEYAAKLAKWKQDVEQARKDNKPLPRAPQKLWPGGVHQNSPTALYNGMIVPLLPYAIKGAIWYQGESNGSRAAEYRTLFPAMIADWRKRWGAELPFFAVQLAPFRADGSEKVSYAELRDAQYHATRALPKVGLAVITDAGDETDIHPQKKEPVGRRLALAARAIAYGEKVEYSGPAYKGLKVEGDKAVVSFDHVGGGLVAKGEALAGFQVAGDDKVFHPAKAEIKGDTVVVSSDKVSKPAAVRFGWINFAKPELNLFNKAGLPAVPFRTDDLPLTTAVPKK